MKKPTDEIRFDEDFPPKEQLPKYFTLVFKEVGDTLRSMVEVSVNGEVQLGNIISDNSYVTDYYRYHDIFHYSFATLLGWSPCSRSLMSCKRKSNPMVDEVEDGARAAITEEAISMIIFNEAKRKDFFRSSRKISKTTLRIIKEMTENFEVRVRKIKDWEYAILQAYRVFCLLIDNKGGTVTFDSENKQLSFSSQN